MTEASIDRAGLLELTSEIVSAHVSNNHVPPEDLASVIETVFTKLADLGVTPEEPAELVPAVPIKKSVTDEHIFCLEDGKPMKMLKRHLATDHGLTPEEYRAKWGLPHDYPMVAPAYARKRQELAKKIGLGRKPAAKRRGRKR